MRIMQHLRSSLLRSEIKGIIPSGLRLGASACVLAAAILMLLLSARSTFGGSATWRLDPGDPFCRSCWHSGAEKNWTPATVPNGPADTATFDVSNVTGIGVDGNDIEVNGIVFNAGASAETWSATGSLATARSGHTATLLPDGMVLVAGGFGGATGYLSSAELYDFATGSWSEAGSLANARSFHTATLLQNGMIVLVAGGLDMNHNPPMASAELGHGHR